MRRSIVAYYFLFVILFVGKGFAEDLPAHSVYIVSGISGDLLIPKTPGHSSAVQYGASVIEGISYVHHSGFTAGITGGFGYFKKGVNEVYEFYRGFDYTQVGIEAGYRGTVDRFSWFALIGAEGLICEYDASVQQFFFPSVTVTGGFGFAGVNAVYLTLPVTAQFRTDLDMSIRTGLGLRLYLNASPKLFSAGDKDK